MIVTEPGLVAPVLPTVDTETPSELPSEIHDQGEGPIDRVETGPAAEAVDAASESVDSTVTSPVLPDDSCAEKRISDSIAIELWNDAFQVVKTDKDMGKLLQEYEKQLKETLAQGKPHPLFEIPERS